VKPLTHRQYEELRTYPTETTSRVVWRAGGHMRSLLTAGYLAEARDGSVTMTPTGRAALTAYRSKWGVAA
jgi:hypothetical protein